MTFLNHPLRRHFAGYAFYLLVAVVITWPLVTVMSSAFAGYAFGDAHEMSRHIWWMKHALQTGQPLFFQPLLGYPNGIEGVILWSNPLQFFPGWLFAFFLPLPAAYNLFVLLTLALNGWAAYFLVSKLTGNQASGLLGGLVFLAAPVMQGHLAGGHGGLLVQWPLPLYAYALFRLRDTHGRALRAIALAVLLFVLVPLGHTLQLIYTLLPLTGVFALALLVRRDWRVLARVVIVGVAGSAILLVFLLPVFSATVNTSAYSAESGVVDFSADLLGIVTPSFNHPLFGQWAYTHAILGVNIVEGSSYIGLAAALLAVAAVWRRKPARWWLLLAAVAWILSLGPLLKVFNTPLTVTTGDYQTLIPLPWALVENWPLFSLARTPGRFGFALALAVAVLAGYGWDVWAGWIESRLSTVSVGAHRRAPHLRENHSVNQPKGMIVHAPTIALFIFMMTFTLWEYQSFWPLPVRPADIPQPVAALAQRDDIRAVFNLPWDNVLAAKDAIYLQTAHEKPLIAGQVTRKTPVSPAKLALLATLDPALLQAAGADVVIVHRQYDPQNTLYETARTQLGEPFFSDDQLALFNVPPTDEQPGFAALDAASNTYLYAPESGWAEYRVALDATGREAVLLLDDVPVYRQFITGETPLRLAFPLTPGFHTVTLTTDPPCPAQVIPPMTCPGVTPVSTPETAFIPAEPTEGITFADGLRLLNAAVLDVTENQVVVALDWTFDQPRTDQDVRFVHVVDATGTLSAQDDYPLGVQSAGEQRVEVVTITLPDDLPGGAYRVYAGWYTFTGPETIQGFAVLSAVPGAADGQVLIGEFTR
ncbi:MAG: hypothetical protein H6672_03410 [Anaerolineaceae bacterium]|nr:hypothetical protein [Anaerolineaceae bacterium]